MEADPKRNWQILNAFNHRKKYSDILLLLRYCDSCERKLDQEVLVTGCGLFSPLLALPQLLTIRILIFIFFFKKIQNLGHLFHPDCLPNREDSEVVCTRCISSCKVTHISIDVRESVGLFFTNLLITSLKMQELIFEDQFSQLTQGLNIFKVRLLYCRLFADVFCTPPSPSLPF